MTKNERALIILGWKQEKRDTYNQFGAPDERTIWTDPFGDREEELPDFVKDRNACGMLIAHVVAKSKEYDFLNGLAESLGMLNESSKPRILWAGLTASSEKILDTFLAVFET